MTDSQPPSKEQVEDLVARLNLACVASCSCLVKTPVIRYHEPLCPYRVMQEAATEIVGLRSALEDRVSEVKRLSHEPAPVPVAWRKLLEPQYDYSDRYRYREDTGIGAPEGWEPLYAARTASSQPPPVDEGAIYPSTRELQSGLLNPAEQVMFRAGLLACRAYMAAFVRQGGDGHIADSILANWWPSLGEDPGQPRKNTFQELTVGEYGEPGFRTKTREEVSPSIEALPMALVFLQGHCGWPEPHYSTATKEGNTP